MTVLQVPHYQPAPPTKADLDYADLPIIDLSKAATENGRQELVVEVRDALFNHGFFYIINHGYKSEQTARMLDIADIPFSQTSDEEKNTYLAKIKDTGSYQGYKLRQYWLIGNGVRDQIEHYNINHDVTRREHPETIRPFIPEIEEFIKHNHFNVLYPILRILALILELPEETFVNMHSFCRPSKGETYVRFMKYHPRPEDEELKTRNVWLRGHTDLGTITILHSQPVAALQVLTKDNAWKWVRHIENALIINTGDALEFLSGGFFKPTIHRVVQPPQDQRTYTRLGLYYFCLTDDDVKLAPLKDSPVLKRIGITSKFDKKDTPTMEQWRKGRTSTYGLTDDKKMEKKENGVHVELVNGIPVSHYN
ncbi:Clavaminate synthase-like protein [Cyathus striatus]|nr:Clavaminate synthase-like protein [Cyathus striatus]